MFQVTSMLMTIFLISRYSGNSEKKEVTEEVRLKIIRDKLKTKNSSGRQFCCHYERSPSMQISQRSALYL